MAASSSLLGYKPAIYTQMGPQFGAYVQRLTPMTAVEDAAKWLSLTLSGQRLHRNVLVQSCLVPELILTGIARIDKLLHPSGSFMSGNVSSDLQSSCIIPAWNCVKVNGFTAHENGVPFQPGDLTKKQLEVMRKGLRVSGDDSVMWSEITDLICGRKGALPRDEDITIVKVIHPRQRSTVTEQSGRSLIHGWLLLNSRGELHYQGQHKEGYDPLMARAIQELTLVREDSIDLLKIEGGHITYVAPQVLKQFGRFEATIQNEAQDFYLPEGKKHSWDQDFDRADPETDSDVGQKAQAEEMAPSM